MKKLFLELSTVFIFVVIVIGFFYQTIFFGKLPVPSDSLVGLYHPWRDLYSGTNPRGVPFKNYLITDPVRQQIPWRKVVIDQWKKGKLPVWNPYNFSGTSLIGNIQAAVFYPGNVIFWLLPFAQGWSVLIVAQPILAGIWMLLYLRNLKLSRVSSLFGALAWSFSGFHIAWLTWGTIGHVSLWLPFLLLAIDKINQSNSLKNASFWGLALAIGLSFSYFAGHTQVFLYILILSITYGGWRFIGLKSSKISPRIIILVGAFVISLLITSVQWIPLISVVRESSRIAESVVWQKEGWFLPWQHLVQFIAPDFFGNPATLNYWGTWNYGEFIGYISIVGMIFVLFALMSLRNAVSVKFWGIALGITLLFLLPTPLAKLPYILHFPILSSLQPTRLMVIVDFALVMLASFGFELWREGKGKKIWLAAGVVGIVLLSLWGITPELQTNLDVARRNLIVPSILFGLTTLVFITAWVFRKKVPATWFGIALVLIVSIDLIRFGWKFTPFSPVEYFFPQTQAITYLQSQKKPFRVVTLDSELFPPNVLGYYGIEDVAGYDPIYSSRYEKFFAALARGKPDISPPYGFNRILTTESVNSRRPLWLLNVAFILSLHEIDIPDFYLAFQEGSTRIYENINRSPRAFFVRSVQKENDENAIIQALYSSDFYPLETAIIEEEFSLAPKPLSQEEVSVDEYADGLMKLTVMTPVDRFLVISNMYDSRWQASIDSKETKLYRADYILQGIIVPSGKHQITLKYL